jgi:hypothetical protein
MSLKKDKQKVLGEFFDDARIKTFLNHTAGKKKTDFELLERAYRGMITENFTTFVRFFIEAGHNINATNSNSDTFLSVIKHHKQAEEYITTLTASGAE